MLDDSRFHIIPSVRDIRYLDKAIHGKEEWLLLSCAHIGNLQELVQRCHLANKKVIINPELVGGLGDDRTAFALMRKMFKVDGVMSGSNTKLLMAKKEGMHTIRRISLEDSLAVDRVLETIKETKSDIIELRPSYYANKFIEAFRKKGERGYIAGGFVDNKDMIEDLKKSGFLGVTTSDPKLWE